MTAPGASRKKPMLLIIQIIALLLLAFGIAVSPTLFSSAPAYNRPWGQVLLTTAVIALLLFGLGRLSPLLNKGLTVVVVIGALIVPAIVIGLVVVTRGEQLSARWEVRSALRKAMKGFGTDEKGLIAVLARLDPLQVAAVRATYQSHIRRDLYADVKSETSGYFR